MTKWYFSVALVAAWLCQAGAAGAQGVMPSPVGAARIPDPLPYAAPPTPPMVEGPIGPLGAPPGPPRGMDLPAAHTSAFQEEHFVVDQHCFFHAGAVGLRRHKLGSNVIAFQDPQNLDTGVFPQGNQPTLQTLNDIGMDMDFGPRVTLGYLWQNHMFELTGFWIPESTDSADLLMPGRVNLFFNNPPIGFEGNNGLWLQADRVATEFRTELWSAEANYRYTNAAVREAQLIAGVRYMNVRESLQIFTDDDGFTRPNAGLNPDPVRQAFYQVEIQNHIIAPQLGFEYGIPVTHLFTVGVTGKAALGLNLAEVRYRLTRGDGLVGFDTRRSETIGLAQIYDAGAFLDFNPMDRVHFRFGYNALLLNNIATVSDQIDFNLANPSGRAANDGVLFYHGPMIELQLLF